MNAEIKDLGKRDIIQIILTEYIALRQEIICCLTTQYQALAFGVPVIGAAFVAGFNWWGREISILIFSIVIPYLILMCLLFWGNQVARMNRAGAYISDFIESKLEILAGEEYRRFFPQLKEPSSEFKLPSLSWELKEQFGGDKRVESIEETFRSVLSWETWLRSKGLQQFYKSFKPWKYYPYTQLSVILTSFLLYWISVSMGAVQISLYSNLNLYTKIGLTLGLIVVWLIIFEIVGIKLKNVATRKRLDPAAKYIQWRYKSRILKEE
jgi:hypothetical protein